MTPADLSDDELHRLLDRSWHRHPSGDATILRDLASRGFVVPRLGVFLIALVSELGHRMDATDAAQRKEDDERPGAFV